MIQTTSIPICRFVIHIAHHFKNKIYTIITYNINLDHISKLLFVRQYAVYVSKNSTPKTREKMTNAMMEDCHSDIHIWRANAKKLITKILISRVSNVIVPIFNCIIHKAKNYLLITHFSSKKSNKFLAIIIYHCLFG